MKFVGILMSFWVMAAHAEPVSFSQFKESSAEMSGVIVDGTPTDYTAGKCSLNIHEIKDSLKLSIEGAKIQPMHLVIPMTSAIDLKVSEVEAQTDYEYEIESVGRVLFSRSFAMDSVVLNDGRQEQRCSMIYVEFAR